METQNLNQQPRKEKTKEQVNNMGIDNNGTSSSNKFSIKHGATMAGAAAIAGGAGFIGGVSSVNTIQGANDTPDEPLVTENEETIVEQLAEEEPTNQDSDLNNNDVEEESTDETVDNVTPPDHIVPVDDIVSGEYIDPEDLDPEDRLLDITEVGYITIDGEDFAAAQAEGPDGETYTFVDIDHDSEQTLDILIDDESGDIAFIPEEHHLTMEDAVLLAEANNGGYMAPLSIPENDIAATEEHIIDLSNQ